MTKKDRVVSAVEASLTFFERTNHQVLNGYDIKGTAEAWTAVIIDIVPDNGIWLVKEAAKRLASSVEWQAITPAKLKQEIEGLLNSKSVQRDLYVQNVREVERLAEAEQDRLLSARTPEQIKEADELWAAIKDGKTNVVELISKRRTNNGRNRKDSNLFSQLRGLDSVQPQDLF